MHAIGLRFLIILIILGSAAWVLPASQSPAVLPPAACLCLAKVLELAGGTSPTLVAPCPVLQPHALPLGTALCSGRRATLWRHPHSKRSGKDPQQPPAKRQRAPQRGRTHDGYACRVQVRASRPGKQPRLAGCATSVQRSAVCTIAVLSRVQSSATRALPMPRASAAHRAPLPRPDPCPAAAGVRARPC